ncbi:hypothetical protein ACT7DA_13435 [Bacillus pacificus]
MVLKVAEETIQEIVREMIVTDHLISQVIIESSAKQGQQRRGR